MPGMFAGGSLPSLADQQAARRRRGLIDVGGLSPDMLAVRTGVPGGDEPQPGVPTGSASPVGGMFAGAPSLVGGNAPLAGANMPQLGDGGQLNQALAANTLLGQQQHQRRIEGRNKALNVIAAGLAGWSAGMGNPAGQMLLSDMLERRREQAAGKQRLALYQAEQEAKAHDPRMVGNSLVQQGPDGSYSTLYTAPAPFDQYASALGYQPGTPEYADAVKNYRLGAWNEDAVAAKTGVLDHRFDRMGDLQDQRLDVTMRGQDLTHGDRQDTIATTRRGQDLMHGDRQTGYATTRRGQDLTHGDRTAALTQRGNIAAQTDNRVRGSAAYTGHGGGRHSAFTGGDETFATGPDGQRYVVRNGKWVNAKTGQPAQ